MQQLTLTAAVKKPLTPAQWLLSSIGWTLASIAGWFILTSLLSKVLDTSEVWGERLLLATAAVAHVLIWYKGVLTTWDTVAEQTEPFWLSIVSACWTLVLLLFQLVCLALLFLALILVFDSSNSGSWSF
ncbi:MAG: hypothetical protein ACRYFZ_06860 [Janthinobacterium lividum]